MELERRNYSRTKTEFDMRIYSSIKSGAYSVRVTDLSKGGAFIRSKFMPNIGETISYELFDEFYKPIHIGNAKVCRLDVDAPKSEMGFGVMFYEQLSPELLKKLDLTIQ